MEGCARDFEKVKTIHNGGSASLLEMLVLSRKLKKLAKRVMTGEQAKGAGRKGNKSKR